MKIKTAILLPFFGLTALITALLMCSDLIVARHTTSKSFNSMLKYEEKMVPVNMKSAYSIIIPYEQERLQLRTEIAANELARLLHEKKIRNAEDLKKDAELTEKATRKIYAAGKTVGYMELFDDNGTGLLSANEKVRNVNYREWEMEFPELYELMGKAIKGENIGGFYTFYGLQAGTLENKYASFVHVPGKPYIMASTVYLNEYTEPIAEKIREMQRAHFSNLKQEISETLFDSLLYEAITDIAIVLIMAASVLVCGYWLAGKISHPIVSLASGVQKIGDGDFQAKIQERGFTETMSLARNFNELGEKLQSYMKNLEKEIGIRKDYESEIRIVAQIQQAILPGLNGEVQNGRFFINARLYPAKEAAGDFYDFFFIGENKIAILIADVSGKGLSAAFFMTIAKTLVNNICRHYPENPEKALEEANNMLARNNPEAMFVTLFLAYCDTETGEISYANAGHHATIKIGFDGNLSEFGVFCNPALGFRPGASYQRGSENLAPGEALVLFTDGIFEAYSPGRKEFFGEERLKVLIRENCSNVNELCGIIPKRIMNFENSSRSDDIAIMTFKRNPA